LRVLIHAMGRGGSFWSGGGGGDWDGSDGFDGESLRRGRKFSAEDLQLLLLSLLEEKPSHGYELIKALEARTGGFYKPSPGVVYRADLPGGSRLRNGRYRGQQEALPVGRRRPRLSGREP
jgi:hypothetical protein